VSQPHGIDVHDVTVELSGQRILHTVSASLHSGAVTALIGPNGSGKSTLLRCLYGALKPQTGRIDIDGDDLATLPRLEVARRLAVVSQENPATFDFTVHDAVALGRVPHRSGWTGLSRGDHDLIDDALNRTGTSALRYRTLASLSGGEKQRVMVARALVQQPRYLLLDEPTNHLDIRYQLEVLHLVRSLGVTAVIALHDLNLVWRWCDRVVLLAGGRVVADGTPDEVLTPQRCGTTFEVDARVMTDTHDGHRLLRFALTDQP
jgi:iron complex transport system ATP-binding protein